MSALVVSTTELQPVGDIAEPGNDLTAERADMEHRSIHYSLTRDPAMRARLVGEYQWLVLLCARRMQRRREPIEDLVQVANIGLLEALDRFDPSYGVTFRTYASATLSGVLRHHYRTTWRFGLPRNVQELHLTVSRAIETLSVQLQRSPTNAELANATGASVDEVVEAIAAGANFWPLPLPPEGGDKVHSREIFNAVDEVDLVDQRLDVRALLSRLPELKHKVLYLRFFEDRTQTEIAQIVGVSQAHVSRIERNALRQLRSSRALNSIAS